ncbi:MAG: OmpA family protein [Pyrinomonadaceae bacterium]
MTAMMALFLVLWLVSQADTEVKQVIAQYFRSPGVFDTQRGGILEAPTKVSKEPGEMTSKEEEQALSSVAMSLKKEFSTRTEFSAVKDQVKIDVTDQGLRIQIIDKADRVSFTSGSSVVSPDAIAVLAEIARGICTLPNPIQVGGHTDRRDFPAGSAYTNWELSTDRANAARRALEAHCVKPEAIKRVVGHADTELLLPADPYAPANRRISITVMRVAESATVGRGQEKQPGQASEPNGAHQKKPSTESETHADEEVKPQAEKDHTANEKSANEKSAPAAAAPIDQRLLKTKLSRERSVSVGVADQLPSHAVRSREQSAHPQPKHE